MKIRVLTAVLAVVAGFGAMAGPASAAPSAAACEPAPTAVHGVGFWDPPVTTSTSWHRWSMDLDADCGQGYGHDVGTYRFHMEGESQESCQDGTGFASLSGSGPSGLLYGGVGFRKVGVHYYIDGSFDSGGHTHLLNLWVDVVPVVNAGDLCYYDVAPLLGHGAVASTDGGGEPPDPLGPVLALVDDAERTVVDPLLCPVLAETAAYYLDDTYVTSEGDVYVAGELVWDCPPYAL